MIDSTFFFFIAAPAYFLSFLFYLFKIVFDPEATERSRESSPQALSITANRVRSAPLDWGHWALQMTRFSVVLATVGIILRTIQLGNASDWVISVFLPVTTTYGILTFFAWIIPLAYLIMERRYRFEGVGLWITGLSFVMLAIAAIPEIAPRAVAPLVPALQSYWLVIHVLFMLVGMAFFTVGFGASALLLWRRHRGVEPQLLKKLEQLSYRANAIGFPFYGIGGIVFGGIWAKHAWGSYWQWDPKETAMLIAWLAYAVYLHARVSWGWRDLKVAWLSAGAYGVVLYAWIGINYFVAGLHSFA